MKKRTMKKMGSFILACLMVISTFATLSTVAYAESNSYKTKINESFGALDSEELAALTADPTTYDISVFIEFESSAEELATLESDDPAERREKAKAYHGNKNKKLAQALELEEAYVSRYAPFAEITYDSLEEYEDNWKEIRRIAKSDEVKDVDVSLLTMENESTKSEEFSDLSYTFAEAFAAIGLTDNNYDGEEFEIGVVEFSLPDDTSHIPSENYNSYGTGSMLHGRLVTTIIQEVVNDVTFHCVNIGSFDSFSAAIEVVMDIYVHAVNMSFGFPNSHRYDNMAAYVDYLSYMTGCLFVKSAGNRGEGDGYITSPGCSINTITVGIANKEGKVSAGSSFLPLTQGLYKPDLIAPGEGIEFNLVGYDDVYKTWGSSLSAPFVSGIAIKLMDEFPVLAYNPGLMKAVLIQSCEKLADQTEEHDTYAGAGIVNYENARQIMLSGSYRSFNKPTNAVDGAFLGWTTVTIPANSTMHLYFHALEPGAIPTSVDTEERTLVKSSYTVEIGRGESINAFTSQYVTYTNTSSQALDYAVMLYVTENEHVGTLETVYIAYDFTPVS